jgi:RHS repeat-associated protein
VSGLLLDHLGSVRNVINASGTVVDTLAYGAFGNITAESNSANTGNFAYTNLTYDRGTGDYAAIRRVYDPRTGRWIQDDPIQMAAGDPDWSRYVRNNPPNEVDITGLQDEQVVPSLVGGAIGGFLAGRLELGSNTYARGKYGVPRTEATYTAKIRVALRLTPTPPKESTGTLRLDYQIYWPKNSSLLGSQVRARSLQEFDSNVPGHANSNSDRLRFVEGLPRPAVRDLKMNDETVRWEGTLNLGNIPLDKNATYRGIIGVGIYNDPKKASHLLGDQIIRWSIVVNNKTVSVKKLELQETGFGRGGELREGNLTPSEMLRLIDSTFERGLEPSFPLRRDE